MGWDIPPSGPAAEPLDSVPSVSQAQRLPCPGTQPRGAAFRALPCPAWSLGVLGQRSPTLGTCENPQGTSAPQVTQMWTQDEKPQVRRGPSSVLLP